MRYYSFHIIIVLLFLFNHSSNGQTIKNIGIPPIHNYGTKDYYAHEQNWSITQNKQGVMYFGNTVGVLEFDGNTWKVYPTPEGPTRAICWHKNKLFATGENLLASLDLQQNKLEPEWTYFINSFVEKGISPIPYISKMISHDDCLYLQAINHIFVFNENMELFVTQSEDQFRDIKSIDGKVYVIQNSVGLLEIDKKANLKLVKELPNSIVQHNLCQYDEEHLMILGEQIQLFNLKTKQLSNWKNNASSFLNNSRQMEVQAVGKNYFSISSYDGMIILDRKGRTIQSFNENKGLASSIICDHYFDKEKQLWLATTRGISKIDIFSPFTIFNETHGLKNNYLMQLGTIHNNKHYFISELNIHSIDWKDYHNPLEGTPQVVNLLNGKAQFFDLEKVGNEFIATAGQNGLYALKKEDNYEKAKQISDLNILELIVVDSTQLFCATGDGFLYLTKENNEWLVRNKLQHPSFKELGEFYLQQFSLNNNKLWINNHSKLFQYKISESFDSIQLVKTYDSSNGINDIIKYTTTLSNKTTIITEGGLYQETENDFSLLDSFQYNGGTHIFRLLEASNSDLYIFKTSANFKAFKKEGHTYLPKNHSFPRISGITAIDAFNLQNDSNIFIADGSNFYHYNPNLETDLPKAAQTLIRNVTISNIDSVISYGYFNIDTSGSFSCFQNDTEYFIDYSNNNFKFEFSLTSNTLRQKNRYSFYLDGFDNNWSSWNEKTEKEYTNIPEGTYTFRVKGKNGFEQIGEEGRFTFTILPPWYRTWWAYISYSILAILAMWGIVKWNTRRLEREKEELEEIVTERTEEVRQQAEEILAQNDQLTEMYDEMEIKNTKITDSINYAKKIQGAMLTSRELIEKMFAEYFILFMPRDIVSGDFYWAYKTPTGKFIWTAADCTGHGVPGAMMSMIGTSLLNEIVIQRGIEEPDAILNNLRDLLLQALERGGSDNTKEGMDISICSLDEEKMELSFAGAHNPLYLFRNGDLTEINGDTMPIGAYKIMDPFTCHTLQVQKNDIIYLFSDGYVDQMGGTKGKKFLPKRFRTKLEAICDLPLKEQEEHLKETFVRWKGERQQMDDVIVFGIKL